MRGNLILHVIHITGTSIIESGINGLSRVNNLVVMMRGLNPIQFLQLYKVSVKILAKLNPWIRNWWGESLTCLSAIDWFEHIVGNLLLDPTPVASETSLELLLESQLWQPYKSHLMMFIRTMTFLWRYQMGNEKYLLFTFPFGIPFWGWDNMNLL